MFESFKERAKPAIGDRVRVYRNLNKPSFYSILAMSGENKGRVLGYSKAVHLTNIKFIVSAKTREKVVLNKCRTVHAYAEGDFAEALGCIPEKINRTEARRITYQPFIHGHFFDRAMPEIPLFNLPDGYLFGADCLSLS